MKWAGHVERKEEMKHSLHTFWLASLNGRDHSEDLSIDGEIGSEGSGLDCSNSGQELVSGSRAWQ